MVNPINDAARKEVAELDDKGLVGKHHSPLSWTGDHFKRDGPSLLGDPRPCWRGSSDSPNPFGLGG